MLQFISNCINLFFNSDEKACLPLTIPNGNYDASTDGWYGERDKIWVRCDEGYEHKDRDTTAQCMNGAWSSVPICDSKSVLFIFLNVSYQNQISV